MNFLKNLKKNLYTNIFRKACNFYQYATDMLNRIIRNGSLTERIDNNYARWQNLHNQNDIHFSKFGALSKSPRVMYNFSYIIDMKTLEIIQEGKLDQAFEIVLQVKI